MVYDYSGNASIVQKLEAFQYNASLAKTGTSFILSLVLKAYPIYGRFIAFYKIVNKKAPQYLIDYLKTQDLVSNNLRKRPAIYLLDARTER